MKLATVVDWASLYGKDESAVSVILNNLMFSIPGKDNKVYNALSDSEAAAASSSIVEDLCKFLKVELTRTGIQDGKKACIDYIISRSNLFQAYYDKVDATLDLFRNATLGDPEFKSLTDAAGQQFPGLAGKAEDILESLIGSMAGDHMVRLEAEMTFLLMSIARLPRLSAALDVGGVDLGPMYAKMQASPFQSKKPFQHDS